MLSPGRQALWRGCWVLFCSPFGPLLLLILLSGRVYPWAVVFRTPPLLNTSGVAPRTWGAPMAPGLPGAPGAPESSGADAPPRSPCTSWSKAAPRPPATPAPGHSGALTVSGSSVRLPRPCIKVGRLRLVPRVRLGPVVRPASLLHQRLVTGALTVSGSLMCLPRPCIRVGRLRLGPQVRPGPLV